MAKSGAAKSVAVDFHVDPQALSKARKQLQRIKLRRDKEQKKGQGEK